MLAYLGKAKLYTALGGKTRKLLSTGNSKATQYTLTTGSGPFQVSIGSKVDKSKPFPYPFQTFFSTRYSSPYGTIVTKAENGNPITFELHSPKLYNCLNANASVKSNRTGSISAQYIYESVSFGVNHQLHEKSGDFNATFALGPLNLGARLVAKASKKPELMVSSEIDHKNSTLSLNHNFRSKTLGANFYHKVNPKVEVAASSVFNFETKKKNLLLGTNLNLSPKTKTSLKLKIDLNANASCLLTTGIFNQTTVGFAGQINCLKPLETNSYTFGLSISWTAF
ncbi:hypothetical protein M0813_22944 [Anaeramoeba flamelloides]|uniref:Uncharacterized protein n=1 Tax=Anaeramoeba flamelloides TaxID=1746091 RepID=A0AAV7YTA4_9EUKA|nr:hypothetical protein M0812_21632 [Anaeramoeba flamelloides]KAJ6242171.1 hypothetical protein M0813_22944 [Anaeramoeba flamelloides]